MVLKQLPFPALATAVLLLPGAVIIGPPNRTGHSSSRSLEAHRQTGSEVTPATDSISRWLWPGAFEIPPGQTARGVTFVASHRRYVAETRSDGLRIRYGTHQADALQVEFSGALRGTAAELTEEIPGELTLITGYRQHAYASNWGRFGVSTFHEVWPGIDARFHAQAGDLELDFLVQPGADPRRIGLEALEPTHFEVDARSGDILIVRALERFRLLRPRAYQPGPAGEKSVAVRALTDGRTVRFDLGEFDHSRALVIDPLIASYSTFIGTNTDAMYDDAAALATDTSGNLYVGGSTQLDIHAQPGDSFPTTPGSLQPTDPSSPGNNCAFGCGYVLKLSPTHQVLYGALIYGFTVKAIAVDAADEAVITGSTLDGTNFPGTLGVFDNNPAGQVFLSKLSADGGSFVYSALFPGDSGNGVAVDAQGNAYVVGQVSAPNLPTTPGTIKPTNPIGATINQDGFLLKVSADGSKLLYGTYLGGSGTDVANAVQVDAQGEAIVAGQTASSDFTGLPSPVSGASDAYLIEVSADASHIVTGQIFGGSADDFATAVAPDGQGGWLVCGATSSADLPTSAGAFQTHLLGQRNGWVRRLDSGFNLLYATYFGGSTIDGCLGIAGDGSGVANLVGVTFSADIPTTSGAFQDVSSAIAYAFIINLSTPFYIIAHDPDREAYFAQLSADGRTLMYGSYLGGYETSPRFYPPLTIGTGVTTTAGGTVYVSGATEAASFPVTDGGLRAGMGGQADGFIVAFASSPLTITSASLLPAAPLLLPYSFTLNAAGGTPPYTWSKVGFELPDGITLSASGVLSGTPANPQTEATGYQFTVKVADSTGVTAYKSLFLNIVYPGQLVCNSNTCVMRLVLQQAASYQLPTLDRAIGQVTGTVSGTLPPGINLTSTGLLAGTPTQAGTYSFVVRLADQSGQTGTMSWQVVVADSSTAASLTVSPTSVSVGQSYTLTWSSPGAAGCNASGGGGNGTPWSGILPSSGNATQTATTVGSFNYTVTCATGGAPVQAFANLTVTAASSGGSGGGGGGAGKSGGGALDWLELVGLLLLAAGRLRPAKQPGPTA